MNCKAVCLYIEEADLGWQPERVVREHLESCDKCRAFHEEQMKLRQLVGSLGTIHAPADFDFRLRARLASRSKPIRQSPWFGGAVLGWPSAAVAALALIVAGIFLMRAPTVTPGPQKAAIVPGAQSSMPEVVTNRTGTEVTPEPVVQTEAPATRNSQPTSRAKRFSSSPRRMMTREYSSVPAKVLNPEDTVASADPPDTIYTSDQPMRMSLDDGSGIQRTISLPRISFGSQRAFASEQTSMVKTSTKGVW